MKRSLKKLLALLLAACLLAVSLPAVTVSAATAEDSVGASSGTTGDCTWTLDDNGTLTISSNGAMGDYSSQYSLGSYVTTAP